MRGVNLINNSNLQKQGFRLAFSSGKCSNRFINQLMLLFAIQIKNF